MLLFDRSGGYSTTGAVTLGGIPSFFCAALLLRLIVTVPRFDFSFYFFLGQWALAVVLALVAATLGSNRWAYAALLPILNWLGSFYLVGG